jgi:hypothetical protein
MGIAQPFRRIRGSLHRLAPSGILLVTVAVGQAGAQAARSTPPSAALQAPAVPWDARSTSSPRPDPGLSPGAVIDVVLAALQHNDSPTKDHGIAITFEFASPANRDETGPLQRFAALVKNPTYRSMLNYRRAERGELRVLGDQARQRVTLVDASGDRVTYLFMLSRQTDGPYKGCWMTDGVVRETELGDTRYERLTLFDIAARPVAGRG